MQTTAAAGAAALAPRNAGAQATPEQQASPLLTERWKAQWIAVPDAPPWDFGVYHFRRAFELAAKPEHFVVHVTADNRYQLFINGVRVAWGPARGDLFHWRYETVDIARHLRPGNNVLAAVVWNEGRHAAVAQISHRTAFLLQGGGDAEQIVNTGKDWRCLENRAYKPLPLASDQRTGYYALGPNEQVNAAAYPWGWQHPVFDDSKWKEAAAITPGSPRESRDAPNRWMLVPRPIPPMEETRERLSRLRKAEGIQVPSTFPREAAAFTVPPNTTARLLLDQDHLTTVYPELMVRGGRGARLSLRYAEALWHPTNREKSHRDEIEGKRCLGPEDVFIANSGRQLFRPLWWRTFRYIEFTIATAAEPATIDDLCVVYTGYPFRRRARFDAGSEELQRILDIGWRTARLCAHETYMDCPYYEQLQYAGDTRIQALVSLYMTGDARLVRNAIEQLDASRTPEGATYSRAPSALQQYIPPFSLWWIGMVHDYWMYAGDPAFVAQMLPGARAVLAFFARRQKANGSLGRLPWWNFVDWVPGWRSGVPPGVNEGGSSLLDLQLLLGLGWAAEMESRTGSRALAAEYRAAETKLRATVRQLYWNPGRGLLADTPAKSAFSQHANALAVLAGVLSGEEARAAMEKAVADLSISQCTIYFRYYLHQAMRRAGLGDRYLDMLGPWRQMLKEGLSTWAEWDRPDTRSDCHAWGASPNIELFRTLLGIDSAAPGFRRVRIEPHLGKLQRASGTMPHPRGEISVAFEMKGAQLTGEITVPVAGEFVWRGKRVPLKPGKNTV